MTVTRLAFIVLFWTLAASSPLAAPGDLDPAFGRAGTVTRAPDGTETLGEGGWMTIWFPNDSVGEVSVGHGHNEIRGVAVQPDGRIVVAGRETLDVSGFTVARLEEDGTLDRGFATTGAVKLYFPGGDAGAFAVAVQPDGKIVTAGSADVPGGVTFALARQNPDGTLDPDFGNAGFVVTDLPSWGGQAYSMALQPDGKIVAAGWSGTPQSPGNVLTVMRYDTAGTLDPHFGAAGLVARNDLPNSAGYAVAIQPDGRIVAAGSDGSRHSVLVRLNPDGTPDTSFGTAGVVLESGTLAYTRAVAIAADGAILTAGGSANGGFGVVRHRADGRVDRGFVPMCSAHALVIQPDGKIVVVGESSGDVAVVRYDVDGSPDLGYATDGKASTRFNISAWALAAAIDPQGRVVAGGFIDDNTSSETRRAIVVRYLGDGTPDPPTTTSTGTSASTSISTSISTTSTTTSTSSSAPSPQQSTSTSVTSSSTIPFCSTVTCDDDNPCTMDRCDQERGCISVPDPHPGVPCLCRRASHIVRCAPPRLARRLRHGLEGELRCHGKRDGLQSEHIRFVTRALSRDVSRMRVRRSCRTALRQLLADAQRAASGGLDGPSP